MKICSVAGFECLDLYFFGSLKQSEIMIAIFIKDVMVLVDLVCQSCKKVIAVFRMLAYGLLADATDEYVKIGKSTTLERLKKYCRAVVEVFVERYLRTPTANDIVRLLYICEQ